MILSHRYLSIALALLVCVAISLTPLSAFAASKTRPAISLTSPASKDVFSKTVDGTIPVTWSAKNVPKDTLLVIELEAKRLAKGSVIAGGGYQEELAKGSSSGTYNIDIETVGTADPGTYKIRALLQECLPEGCDLNPFFPGVKKTKTYAKSAWKHIRIEKTARTRSVEETEEDFVGEVSVRMYVNGNDVSATTLDADDDPTFTYYPSGDIDTCSVIGTYTEGSETVKHAWKNEILPNQSGTATFSVAGVKGQLESVKVRCKNSQYEASDTIKITIADSGEAAYKILIGSKGQRTFKRGTGSEAEARSYCSEAYNDPDIHEFTRVQCYWDGDRFEDVREFKG